jgi:chromosome segregation ATPase
MASEQGQSQEADLEKTDRLPILTSDYLDPAVMDDAVRMNPVARSSSLEATAERPALTEGLVNAPALASSNMSADFIRPSPVDLPSLAETLRAVEERIAHQQAEYEILSRSFDRARDNEEAAKLRAGQLEADLGSVRAVLESVQARTREQEKNIQERAAALDAARARAEEALREAERHQSESHLLKDSLAARDATIAQVLHSLGERDAQLSSLQQDHAKMQKLFETRNRACAQLDADLQSTKLAVQELSTQLKASKESVAALTARLKRSDGEVNTIRAELGAVRTQSASYLELLRTREYRRGFDENQFLELDARVGIADAGHNALKTECDRLLAEAANRDLQIAAQNAAVEKLQANVSAQVAIIARQAHDLKQIEEVRTQLDTRLGATEAELKRVTAELAVCEAALKESRESASADAQRMSALLSSAEQRHAEQTAQFAQAHAEHAASMTKMQTEHASAVSEMQSQHASAMSHMQTDHGALISHMQSEHMAQVAELQSNYALASARVREEQDAELAQQKAQHDAYVQGIEEQLRQREQESSVLLAHLKEARRPIEPIEAEVKRLNEELTAKTAAFDELEAEASKLRTSLERTRGALEEREFLIRRLERSESNNANVLGRIQTSMERLGTAPIASAALSTIPESSAELIRIDGGRNLSHTLGRRTRIGRGAGCELQVDSSSVSRHHALILVGPRDTIIEDLNSTNGVILNGRKITRAFLTDGDTVIIGEVHFRYVAKAPNLNAPVQPPLEAAPVN